jgi:hypothetical protein
VIVKTSHIDFFQSAAGQMTTVAVIAVALLLTLNYLF